MRELLSGALPAPQDEPPQRDVIDPAMDWGARRRRRDWTLTGAAALAVVALATGVAALSGGGGSRGDAAAPGGQAPTGVSTHRSMGGVSSQPTGSGPTQDCQSPGNLKGSLADFCKVFDEQRNFNADFAKGSVPFIQAALPPGFSVRATSSWVLILTGPDGTTNYLFPSTEPTATLNGQPPGCGTPAPSGCLQTSTAGGRVVVNTEPSGQQSAGYFGDLPDDARVDLLVGTSVSGAMNGIAPPTAKVSLLSDTQLAKIMGDPQLLQYAKAQLGYLKALSRQLAALMEPSSSGPYSPPPGSASGSGVPSSGTSGWSSPPLGWQSSPGDPSWHSPSGGQSSSALPPGESYSQPSGSQSSPGS
ncbi:hypothetical protein [Catenulispora rubra]|uniref:hypothetical protein n=1 Tax=Catenulispora rubra TaxID=280293 RepID=UPI0018920318|nr:hypothetical protein [Catenulispora rubra]